MKKTLFLALIVILFASCGAEQTKQDLLQGTWVSTEDSNSKLIIKDNQLFYSYYDQVDEPGAFILADECVEEKTQNNPNGSYIIVFLEDVSDCYSISKLDSENLEIIFLARGNTLVYKKQTN